MTKKTAPEPSLFAEPEREEAEWCEAFDMLLIMHGDNPDE